MFSTHLSVTFCRPLVNVLTFSGFYATLILHFVTTLTYFTVFASVPIFQIGFCTYIRACATDFKTIIKDIEEHVKNNYSENDFRPSDHFIRSSFKDAVGLHINMLR